MITQAALRDSRTMKTIALMTLIFLPGTLVAVRHHCPSNTIVADQRAQSIFSTDLFDLRSISDGANTSFVAHYWWVLVLTMVVVTVIVIGVWCFWDLQVQRPRDPKEKV